MSEGVPEVLTGWGRTSPTKALVVHEDRPSRAVELAVATGRGLIARGLGRSYGDAAQNAGGVVLGQLPSRIEWVSETSEPPLVRVSAGASLDELIRFLLPTGHFVPVTPGTRQVTLGGAVAADVHGKNHHRMGSIGRHLASLDLVLADGTTTTVGPDRDAELFWATVGGMGLTGVITSVVLRVLRVETGYMRVRTERIATLEELMTRMRAADSSWTYSVAWIDTSAAGRHLGRSILTCAEHAEPGALPEGWQSHRWAVPRGPRLSVPAAVPPGVMSRPAIRVFNEAWYRRAPGLREGGIESTGSFFHPLDAVGGWNRLYGPRGLVQYQFVVPDEAEGELVGVLRRIADAGHPSFLSVLKRFGPGTPGPLSFPMPGWSLAMDLAVAPGLASLLAELDEAVAGCGGRLYLAKDSRMPAPLLERTYPRLDEFRSVRDRVDPTRVFRSDLSRRLDI